LRDGQLREGFVAAADDGKVRIFPESKADWTNQEKFELQRLREAYAAPYYEMECSVSEDGDPWCVVSDKTLDRVVIHIARIGRIYMIVHPERGISSTVAQFKHAIDILIQDRN
jgi:hypothetical protein